MKTITGALPQNVGFPGGNHINGGVYINPNKEELMKKAGFFTIKDMTDVQNNINKV